MSKSQRHPSILIVGAGSVGKRHLTNFAALGCRVSAMDNRRDRLAQAGEAAPLEHAFDDWEQALGRMNAFNGVAVCTPPKYHVAQASAALERGIPVFLEKPVSLQLDEALRLSGVVQKAKAPLLLGYTYRWWPPIRRIRELLIERAVGKVLHVRCVMSACLADWHPWERYQDFYMASASLGGGALLDESHFVDLLLWFFGAPDRVWGSVGHVSSLEIDTDDTVDMHLVFQGGQRAAVHLDLYGRPHERSFTIVGESGTIHWSCEENVVKLGRGPQRDWTKETFSCERNEMFAAAAREFVRVVDGQCAPTCTIDDGCAVMRVIEAVRASSANGQMVNLS